VATAVGGVPGIVKDAETGILVEPDDPGALAEGMSQMLADPERALRLAEAAADMVAREYSLEPMVRATEDVYRQVLDV